MMILFAAFLAGLFGSVHCIGMCGGLVGLINQPIKQGRENSKKKTMIHWLITNTGRLVSYTFAGATAGTVGSAAVSLFNPAYVQNIGLMLSGSFMVALGLYLAGWWQGLLMIEKIGRHLWRHIQPLFSGVLSQRGALKSFLTGALWGWLPCGLVYSMLVWSMTVATPLGGGSIMLAFGIGTMPMLIGLGALTNQLNALRQRRIVLQGLGALIICFGLLTLLGLVHPFHVPLFANPLMCESPMLP